MTTDRYYVSLTATCQHEQLDDVIFGMQTAMRGLAGAPLDGLSLSFTRDDDNGTLTDQTVTALPVVPAPPAPATTEAQP